MPRLADILIRHADEPLDSLVVSLRELLRWHHGAAHEVPTALLAASTGAGALLAAAPGESDPSRWIDYGRDVFLVEAAADWGLELRDLHPPAAAPLPQTPPEFDGHFRDSYVPLIRASLAHGQPVLAWQGWPGPRQGPWGVVTGFDATTGACTGTCPSHPGRLVHLEGAALQAYVVQGFGPPAAPVSRMLLAGVDRMERLLRGEAPAGFSVVTGEAALVCWQERAAGSTAAFTSWAEAAAWHARSTCALLTQAIRIEDGARAERLHRLSTCLGQVSDALTPGTAPLDQTTLAGMIDAAITPLRRWRVASGD